MKYDCINEYHNGVLRRYLPKGTDFDTIEDEELQDIVNQVQAQAFSQARQELAAETGLEEIDIQLVNAAIVSVVIDGYKVTFFVFSTS